MNPRPVPSHYEAEGTLVIVGKAAILEDPAGVRWPLGVLLRELAGKSVRLRVEPVLHVKSRDRNLPRDGGE